MFNQLWKIVSAFAGLIAGFFFVKSKIQEKKIEKQQAEIETKEQQIEAKESEIVAIKKQHENELDIKELSAATKENENRVEKETVKKIDEIEEKVYNEKDNTEYKVVL